MGNSKYNHFKQSQTCPNFGGLKNKSDNPKTHAHKKSWNYSVWFLKNKNFISEVHPIPVCAQCQCVPVGVKFQAGI